MDFGCGVGRLTLALAGRADEIVGVDISNNHLILARQRAEQVRASNARFEQIGAVDDLDRFRDFDLIVSLIVLQHNPPPVMAAILRKLLDALAPGGTAVAQIPTYIDGVSFNVADYLAHAQPEMELNALPQHVIFDIIDACDCCVFEVREDTSIGVAGLSHRFAIEKRRSGSVFDRIG